MKIEEKISYWVEISEYDLETAKAVLQKKRFLYVGFMLNSPKNKRISSTFFRL